MSGNSADPVTVGRMEVADFPGIDENGEHGLVTKMRPKGSGAKWQPYDRAALAADRFLTTGRGLLEQDVWWKDGEGTVLLIDDLTDDRRRYIARMLIDRAALMFYRHQHAREISAYWSFVAHCDDKGWNIGEREPTPAEIRSKVRVKQDHGEHLTWVRNSPLFRRMIRNLDWTHPSVTGTDLDTTPTLIGFRSVTGPLPDEF